MYNCIQSGRRLQDAADCSRLYAVQLELLDPRILLIPYGCVLFEQHTVGRHINRPYL